MAGADKDFWYSAKTALDWLVCHYGMQGRHFAWFAPEFDTYRFSNPESSNPSVLYHDYVALWRDKDMFSHLLSGKRLSISNGIEKNVDAGILERPAANLLKELVERADIGLFYPMVYRVEKGAIDPTRCRTDVGSGATGSNEFFISDLQEQEFDLLFAHFREEADLKPLILDVHGLGGYAEISTLADLVWRRLTVT